MGTSYAIIRWCSQPFTGPGYARTVTYGRCGALSPGSSLHTRLGQFPGGFGVFLACFPRIYEYCIANSGLERAQNVADEPQATLGTFAMV